MRADRDPVERPSGAPYSFACPACDVVLWDGVDYTQCPACSEPVDWIDPDQPLWCCPRCDAFVNEPRAAWPRCGACDLAMIDVHVGAPPEPLDVVRPTPLRDAGLIIFGLVLVAQFVVLSLDPIGRVVVLPVFLVAIVGAVGFLLALFAGLGELRALVRDRKNRVIHGLEHATVKLLEEGGHKPLFGQTHDGFFELTVRHEGRVSEGVVQDATRQAIRRIWSGDRALAFDPRCGTSLLVALALVAMIVVLGCAIGFVLGADLGAIAAATGVAGALGWFAARPLGLAAQRAWTVSTNFHSARVVHTTRTISPDGSRALFVVHVAVGRPRATLRPADRRCSATGP